jgi:hypothetical protein
LRFLNNWPLIQFLTMAKDNFWSQIAAGLISGLGVLAADRATENRAPTAPAVNIYIVEKRQATGASDAGMIRKPEGGEPPRIPTVISEYSFAGVEKQDVVVYSNQATDIIIAALNPSQAVPSQPKIEAEIRTPSGQTLINYLDRESIMKLWDQWSARTTQKYTPADVYKIKIDMFDDPNNPRVAVRQTGPVEE